MKRDYLVLISLFLVSILILLSGWGSYFLLNKDSKKLLAPVEEILVSIENDNWMEVNQNLNATKTIWREVSFYWPMLIHHEEMDRIEESLNKLKSYLQHRDENQALAELYNLIYFIKHIPQKEAFNIQNIF
jgi:predicted P-loop ATPase